MRFRLAILTIIVIQVQSIYSDDTPVRVEVKNLQGKWIWVSVDMGDGWTVCPTAIADHGAVVIKDDVITFGHKGSEAKWKFTVDLSTKPKVIDLELLEGDSKGRKMSGIYSIEQGELRLCLPTHRDKATRPSSFDIKEADRLFVGTLTKSK